jgi:hypothetical protein
VTFGYDLTAMDGFFGCFFMLFQVCCPQMRSDPAAMSIDDFGEKSDSLALMVERFAKQRQKQQVDAPLCHSIV